MNELLDYLIDKMAEITSVHKYRASSDVISMQFTPSDFYLKRLDYFKSLETVS